ncbi:N-acetylmannosamine-6-phosphate 2-epimerase [Helcococcus kunzii]|uniref:N-acetylmannosamine-6-phosphate 2-epimerase n=1 Tax=Helcococcus kunzii TaxID=40091 RepID=UPI001BAEED9E|nr:N-acetylmannosamine-6-phosphate 2-epimerase [Helcococcus kunzii]QUY65215.1 N-acetylmannosamine-6-phosphate 2-epimerase [Helcococcus kunzii]QZO75876.1 N-acetylmannosamine-6-phosphate 2-epimerase [Helcococcus kunzii]
MCLEKLKGKLIVSCQALTDEPLHSSFIMGRMAIAAKEGGASGIRAQSVEDILEIQKQVDLPIIGIIKKNYPDSEVFITPTKNEVEALLTTNCEIIALDATNRKRPNDEKIEDLVELIHSHGKLAMADCSTLEECLEAEKIGFDILSTTLFGYTNYSKNYDRPDFESTKKIVEMTNTPVIAEGKINTPEDLKKVYECGVYSAVVGSAITRPQLITKKFVDVLGERFE